MAENNMGTEFSEDELTNVVGGANPEAAEEIHKQHEDLFRECLTPEELEKVMAALPKDEFGNPILPNDLEEEKGKSR